MKQVNKTSYSKNCTKNGKNAYAIKIIISMLISTQMFLKRKVEWAEVHQKN